MALILIGVALGCERGCFGLVLFGNGFSSGWLWFGLALVLVWVLVGFGLVWVCFGLVVLWDGWVCFGLALWERLIGLAGKTRIC